MKDNLGHGSESQGASRAVVTAHAGVKSIGTNAAPNFDAALLHVKRASAGELVEISRGQRVALANMATKRRAMQVGEAFQ